MFEIFDCLVVLLLALFKPGAADRFEAIDHECALSTNDITFGQSAVSTFLGWLVGWDVAWGCFDLFNSTL